jgi:hypothetical protein
MIALSSCREDEAARERTGRKDAPEPEPKPSPDTAPTETETKSGGKDPQVPATTINEFFAQGTPTFVRGTKGTRVEDRRIATQIDLMRGLVFPGAVVMDDTHVDRSNGRDAWPDNAVVYGGRHVNASVEGVVDEFDLDVDATRVRVGETVLEGDDLRLIAVVPASDDHPSFVWYAGTGPAGVAEINAGIPTGHALVVADRFGLLAAGQWAVEGGRVAPTLGPRQRRIEYRSETRSLPGFGGGASATVTFEFPSMVAESPADEARIEAALAGLQQAVNLLQIREPVDMAVYLYPDRKSKQQLTGNGGDGHAVPSSRTLHVLAAQPSAMTSLVAHEGTHVLGYYAVGPAATPLMGEGMAVWVSGSYGGKSLAQLRDAVEPVAIERLLGPQWAKLPEQHKYPLAATAFEAAVKTVGLPEVGEHLMSATPATWSAACAAAGTTPEVLDAKYREAF